MIFEGARNHDDPELPPFHPDRLGLGMLDIQQRRQREAWPERMMRRVRVAFLITFWLFLGFAVTATIWVQW